MFLKKTPNKSGRINLAIVDGYYDKATKKTKHKVIESLGYLDELEKQYDDPTGFAPETTSGKTLGTQP